MSTLLELLEKMDREFRLDKVDNDIHGKKYIKKIIELQTFNTDITIPSSGEICNFCNKKGTIRVQVQLRSGDEGESTIIYCPSCTREQKIA